MSLSLKGATTDRVERLVPEKALCTCHHISKAKPRGSPMYYVCVCVLDCAIKKKY